jgi:hypothetical protein
MSYSRSWRSRRLFSARREAFWHIGPERLVVGVMEARVDEPLLVACADLFTRAGTALGVRVAPGLLDVAQVVEARDLDHIVALDGSYFEIVGLPVAELEVGVPAVVPAETGDDRIEARVCGAEDSITVRIDRGLVETVAQLFACASLNLIRLDCAHAAAFNLRNFASGQAPPGDAFAEAVRADPLAAVSVAAHCEAAASILGESLSVPVGLALGRYGFVDDG